MRVFSYLRFSTPEQARGDSFRRQTDEPERWCKERGLELDNSLTLHDLGRSAFKGGNAQFGALRQFLDLVEAGTIERGSILLVESLDRLSREAVLDAAARLLDLIRAGVTVVTLSDGQQYSEERLRADWTPLIMSLTIMARAHEESRLKSLRVGKAWEQKRLKAQAEKQAQTSACPAWMQLVGGPKSGHYELIPERAAVVRQIFADTINGLGRRKISKALNARGVDTWGVGLKKGLRWHDSYIQKILGNAAVFGVGEPLGRIAGGDGSVPTTEIRDYYPAVIDEQTFYAAQASAKARGKGTGNPGSHRNLLRGLAKCGCCGGNMSIVDKGSRSSGPKLVCGAAMANAGCSHQSYYRYSTLEMTAIFGLGRQTESLAKSAGDKAATFGAARAALEAKLSDLKRRQTNLFEIVETDGGGGALSARLTELKTVIDAVASEIRDIEQKNKVAQANEPTAISGELMSFYAQLKGLEGDELAAARARIAQRLKSLVKIITMTPEKISIEYADGSTGGFMPVVHQRRQRTAAWMPHRPTQSISGTSPA